MHNYTLLEEDSNSGLDERAKQKKVGEPKQKKRKKDGDDNPEVCTSVRIYMHVHASLCISMHLCASVCMFMH